LPSGRRGWNRLIDYAGALSEIAFASAHEIIKLCLFDNAVALIMTNAYRHHVAGL